MIFNIKGWLRQDDSPHGGKNHLMTVLAPIYFVIFVLVNVVVAILMKKLDFLNDNNINYIPLIKQLSLPSNFTFHSMSSIAECSEKGFVHGRSVDEEGEQQDIDDDLFDKKEHIDENAESTDEEIHPEKEKDLLWLTREGLMKPLSLGWKACQEENEEFYYYYFNTEKSSWDHPYDDIYKTHVIQAR
ncbi:unnamed protein product [Rotaria sp. Silwood1]|nr:unnamed protein product [Rotaria sp. Silwood1]